MKAQRNLSGIIICWLNVWGLVEDCSVKLERFLILIRECCLKIYNQHENIVLGLRNSAWVSGIYAPSQKVKT